MILLFGSYARGTWVEDRYTGEDGIVYEFQSDFDIYKKAAFELHQATERFFMTTLLVFTNYKPKIHDLEKLNRHVINQHHSFFVVFPQSTEWEKQNFILLKRTCIDARYHMDDFEITKEQLEWLVSRVEKLRDLTQKLPRENREF